MINHRPLPNHQAAHYIEQVARAVDYAHREQILHRDLKPSNIMIDTTDRAFVTDFGLAKVIGQMTGAATQSTDRLGTLAYMAPEQVADPTRAVIESDVYSLGATLYEAITGQPPFLARRWSRLLRADREARAPTPPAAQSGARPRPGDHLPEMPGEGARWPLPISRPPCGRPSPLPRPQADHRPPLRPDRFDQEVGPGPVARGPGLDDPAAPVRDRYGHPDRTAEKPCGEGEQRLLNTFDDVIKYAERHSIDRPDELTSRSHRLNQFREYLATIAATPASPASRRD